MDIGLIILGVIVLLGAGVLFKSTGILGKSQALDLGPESQPIRSPTQPTLPFESPATVGRGEFRICRNCFSENPMNSEYCSNCGKKLIRPKDLKISEAQRKWFRQFNWTHNPFTPDIIPSLFTGYEEQVDGILKKLSLRSGNIMVLGDFGAGKTTLLRWLELNLPDSFHPIYVFRPPDKFSELIDVVAYSLDSSRGVKPGEYSIYNIDKLVQRVNKNVVVLLDEAHELDFSLNKSLKTLGDIENVNLVLAGLPRLEEKIMKESPALHERIVSKVELLSLTAEESEDLIVKRIENAGGWGHEPFTDDACDEIYRLTNGNPRAVIKLCDGAVTHATSAGILLIDRQLISQVSESTSFPVKAGKPPSLKPQREKPPERVETPNLRGVVEGRIRKLDRLHDEYLKANNLDGIKEVIGIAESTVAESRKRLKDESLKPKEEERLKLMVELFEEWLNKIKKKTAS